MIRDGFQVCQGTFPPFLHFPLVSRNGDWLSRNPAAGERLPNVTTLNAGGRLRGGKLDR